MPLEAQRPQVASRARIEQLRSDPQTVARALYAALDEITGIEPATDVACIHIAPAEGERRGTRNHRQALHRSQPMQHPLGNPRREKAVIRLGAQVLKRQNGHCARGERSGGGFHAHCGRAS